MTTALRPFKGEIPDEDRSKFFHPTLPVTCRFLPKPPTLKEEGISECPELESLPKCPTLPAHTDTTRTMGACVWEDNDKLSYQEKPRVLITDPEDAVIRVTSSTIGGSDLPLYHGKVPEMKPGNILGHECMGIVESVGKGCKLNIGDRVVVSAIISCGRCIYCQNNWHSLCDVTNPSKTMEEMYGHRISGAFGSSHLTGGYEGCQAEFVRVPFADYNTLKVPENLPDEKVLFLSDIACTGWHANECGGVDKDCTVAIWGCGPVGLMTGMWSQFRGASRVVMIDNCDYRLKFAALHLGVETINCANVDVVETMKGLIPHGPDVCIECVGFRTPTTLLHKLQKGLGLESDHPEVLTQCIRACRKGGSVACIGDYFGFTNNFPIGHLMEKSIMFKGGQVFVQRYWNQLLSYIEKGLVDPSFVITHTLPLNKIEEGYNKIDKQEENVIKILLRVPYSITGEK